MLERLKSFFRADPPKPTGIARPHIDTPVDPRYKGLGVHTIFIETISRCNLKCTYCHRTTNEYASKNKKMEFPLFKQIIDQIDIAHPVFQQTARALQQNRPCLYLHGYGEPTLHPDLTAHIAYASKSGKFHEVRMVSNLLVTSKETYHAYFAAGLTHLYVSIDTLDANKVAATRVGTDVEKLEETFSYLAKHFGDKIRVITVLSQANKREIGELYDYLGKRGICEWVIQLMMDHSKNDFAMSTKEVEEVNALFSPPKHKMRLFLEGQPYPRCTQPMDTMIINVLGHLAACCTYFSNDYIDFGQVQERPLLELFTSEKFAAFRNEFEHQPPPLCESCPYYGRKVETADASPKRVSLL